MEDRCCGKVSLDEVLEARGGPLSEAELWSILSQSVLAIQDLSLHYDGRKTNHDHITPEKLFFTHDGSIELAIGCDTNEASGSKNSTFSKEDFERICIYSLGETLSHAKDFSLTADKSKIETCSSLLISSLQLMCQKDVTPRVTLSSLFELVVNHATKFTNGKPFCHYTMKLYEEILGEFDILQIESFIHMPDNDEIDLALSKDESELISEITNCRRVIPKKSPTVPTESPTCRPISDNTTQSVMQNNFSDHNDQHGSTTNAAETELPAEVKDAHYAESQQQFQHQREFEPEMCLVPSIINSESERNCSLEFIKTTKENHLSPARSKILISEQQHVEEQEVPKVSVSNQRLTNSKCQKSNEDIKKPPIQECFTTSQIVTKNEDLRPEKNQKELNGPEFVVRSQESSIELSLLSEINSATTTKMQVTVVGLTGHRFQISCDFRSTRVSDIFSLIVRQQNIKEKYLYGLACLQDGEFIFAELDSSISKNVQRICKHSNKVPAHFANAVTMYFRVKFYIETCYLRYNCTKHLYYLQLRKDFLENKFPCDFAMTFLLASYAMQAEFGDFERCFLNNNRPNAFAVEHYLPVWIREDRDAEDIRNPLLKLYRTHSGMARDTAAKYFVDKIQTLQDYGFHYHVVHKKKNDSDSAVVVGIAPHGISLRDKRRELSNGKFPSQFALWPNIPRISFDRSYFMLTLQRGNLKNHLLKYRFHTKNELSRYLFDLASSHHRLHLKLTSRSPVNVVHPLTVERNGNYLKSNFHESSAADFLVKAKNPMDSIKRIQSVKYVRQPGLAVCRSASSPSHASRQNTVKTSKTFLQKKFSIKPKIFANIWRKNASTDKPVLVCVEGIDGVRHVTNKGSCKDDVKFDASTDVQLDRTSPEVHPDETINESLAERFANMTGIENRGERFITRVTLMRSGSKNLGIKLVEGQADGATYVKCVSERLRETSSIKPGDRIVAVNGKYVESLHHSEVINFIRQATGSVSFVLSQATDRGLSDSPPKIKIRSLSTPVIPNSCDKSFDTPEVTICRTLPDNKPERVIGDTNIRNCINYKSSSQQSSIPAETMNSPMDFENTKKSKDELIQISSATCYRTNTDDSNVAEENRASTFIKSSCDVRDYRSQNLIQRHSSTSSLFSPISHNEYLWPSAIECEDVQLRSSQGLSRLLEDDSCFPSSNFNTPPGVECRQQSTSLFGDIPGRSDTFFVKNTSSALKSTSTIGVKLQEMVSKPEVKSSSSDEEDTDSEEEYTEADDDIESSKENSRKTPTTGNEESSSSEEEEEEEEEEEQEAEDEEEESSEEEEESESDDAPLKQVVKEQIKTTNDSQVILEEDETVEEPLVADIKEAKKILWTPQFSGSVKARISNIETTQAVTPPALSRSNSRGSFSQSSKPGVSVTPGCSANKSQPGMLQPAPERSGRTSPVGEWFKAVASKRYEPHLGFPRLCRSNTMPSVFGQSIFGAQHQDEDDSTDETAGDATVANSKSDSRPPWVSERKIKQMVESGTPWWARAKSIDAGERLTSIVPVRSVSMSRKASTPHVPWSVVPAKMADTNNSPFKTFNSPGSGASAFKPPVKQSTTQGSPSPKMPSSKVSSKITSPKMSPKMASPKMSPKIVSPKMSPKMVSPKMSPKMALKIGHPKNASAVVASPKITSPVTASPKTTSPVLLSPKITSPVKASPKVATPKIASTEVAQLVETQIIHYPNASLPIIKKVPEVGTLSSQQHSPEAKAKARSVLVKKVPSSPPILLPSDALSFSPETKKDTDSDEPVKFFTKPVQQRVLLAEMESFSSSDLSSPDISSPLQQELMIPPPLPLDSLGGIIPLTEKNHVANLAKEFEPPSHNIRHMAEGGEAVSRLQKKFNRAQSFESPSLNKRPQQPPSYQKELKVPPPLSLDTLNGFGHSNKKANGTAVRPNSLLSKFAEPHKVEAPVLPFARDTHVTHGIVAARLQEHVKRSSSPVENFLNHPRDHQHTGANNRSPQSPHNAAGNSMVDSFFSKLSRSSSECLKIPSSSLHQRPPSPVRPAFDFFNGASGSGPKQQVREFTGVSHHSHQQIASSNHCHQENRDTNHYPVIRKDNSCQEVPKSLNLHTLDPSGRLSPQSMKKDEKLAELRMRYPFINPQTLFEVNLVKNSRGLGICICGGNDPDTDDGPTIPFIRIKTLYPLQPALECGKLRVGDVVLCVNKRHLTWLNHNDAVDALRVAPINVCLTMCRPPPGILPPVPQSGGLANSSVSRVSSLSLLGIARDAIPIVPPSSPKHFEVVMEKWSGSLGFTLHRRDERHHHPGHYIKELVKDPALTDGRLQPGDELVKVNGTSIRTMSHAEAIQFLRSSPTTVTLSIRRDIEPSSSPVSPLSPMEPFPPPLSESPTIRGDKKILRKEAQDLLSDKSRRKNGDSSISPFGSPKSRRQRRRAGGHVSPSDLSASPSTLSGDSTGDLNSTADMTSESIFSTASEGLDNGDPRRASPSESSADSQLDAIKHRLFQQPSFENPSPRRPSPAPPALIKLPRPTSLDLSNGVSEFQERAAIFGTIRPKVSGSASSVPALCVSKYDSSDGTTTSTTEETDSDGPAARGGPTVAHSGGGSPRFPFATEPPRMLPPDFTRSPVASPRNSFRIGQINHVQPARTSTPVAPSPLKRAATTLTAVEQMKQELFTVELERTATNNRLGFSLFAVNTSSLKGSFVRVVHPGTIAFQDGRLRAGDELLKVNGIYVGHTPTDSIIELLRVQKGKIVLEVLRNPAITNAVLAEIK